MARRLTRAETLDDVVSGYLDVDRSTVAPRPWVLANMVVSLTGSTSVGDRVGALSGPEDARLFTDLRAVADVVLVGAETVRRERYGPVRLPEHLAAHRLAHGRPLPPRIAVVSRSLAIDWDIPAFASTDDLARPIVLTCTAALPERRAEAARHAEVIVAGDQSVDLRAACAALGARGHRVILCEGGPRLLGEILDLDLLDELCLSISSFAGGDGLPLVTGADRPLTGYRLGSAIVADDDSLLLRYERRRTTGEGAG